MEGLRRKPVWLTATDVHKVCKYHCRGIHTLTLMNLSRLGYPKFNPNHKISHQKRVAIQGRTMFTVSLPYFRGISCRKHLHQQQLVA